MPIPEKVVAEVVKEAGIKMKDPKYASTLVGSWVQSQPNAVKYVSSYARELGGAEGVVNLVFHAALIGTCFLRHHGRSVRAMTFAELDAVAADLRLRRGITTTVHRIDVLDMERHADALAPCLTAELRGAVLAFGYLGDQRRAETDPAEARRILDTNLTGCVIALNLVAAHLARTGGGFVCALSSVAGERGRQSNYIYGAAKAGLTAYLSGLRNRLAGAGVRVLTVKAGVVDTRMSAGTPGSSLAAFTGAGCVCGTSARNAPSVTSSETSSSPHTSRIDPA
jgi:short-subunit dehydrogenase